MLTLRKPIHVDEPVGVPIEYAECFDYDIDNWVAIEDWDKPEVLAAKPKPVPLNRRAVRLHRRKILVNNVVKHAQYSLLASKLGDVLVDYQIRRALRNYTVYERGWDDGLSQEEILSIRNDRWALFNGEGQINRSPDRSQKTFVTLYTIPREIARYPIIKDAYHLQYVRQYVRADPDSPDYKTAESGPGDNGDRYSLIWEGWSTDKFNTRNMEKGFGVMAGFPRDVNQHYPIMVRGIGIGFHRRNNNQLVRVDPVSLAEPYEPASLSEPHGELDLYPNKEKVGDDDRDCVRFVLAATRWIVTTFGNGGGKTTTDVTVDDQGDVARVNSITVSSNDGSNELTIDRGDADESSKPTIKVKIADEYRDDYFFAYKAVVNSKTGWPAIAKLRIPTDATIMGSRFETKMRCNKALVEQIWEFELDNGVVKYTEPIGIAKSCVYKKKSLTYEVGQWVEMNRIDETHPAPGQGLNNAERDACAPGIHWCFTQEDALRFHFVRIDCIANAEIFEDANQVKIMSFGGSSANNNNE